MEIERLLRIRWAPGRWIRSQVVRPRRRLSAVLPYSRVRPRRKRRDRDHLRTLRRVTEEPRLVNSRLRTSSCGMGGLLVKCSASL